MISVRKVLELTAFSGAVVAALSISSITAHAQSPYWTPYVSDEDGVVGPSASCPTGIVGIQSEGYYSDNVRIACKPGNLGLSGSDQGGKFFSDEKPNDGYICPPGKIAVGLACRGGYCDDMSLYCADAGRKLENCRYLPVFSNETAASTFPNDVLVGIKCRYDFCWQKQPYVCSLAEVKISKPRGYWKEIFVGGPPQGEFSISESLDIGTLDEKSWSNETRQSLSATIEAGVEFGAASGSVSITGSTEQATASAGSIVRSKNDGYTAGRLIPYDREKYEWGSMYQWVVEASVQGQIVTIKTFTVACSPGNSPPTYLPGSPQHLGGGSGLGDCGIPRQTAGGGGTAQQPVTGTSGIAARLAGTYRRSPVQSPWHIGRITQDSSGFRWTNEAGVSWVLTLDPSQTKLVTSGDNPYASEPDPHFHLIESNGNVLGFRFMGENYDRQ